ncbi:hypothetical protein GC175_25770 [bacterium]|nr:hypothetical protein [bacterium]
MAMTSTMAALIQEIETLPAAMQDELAERIRAELEAERRWDDLFADPRSEDLLSRLAAEALDKFNQGETLPLEPEDIR